MTQEITAISRLILTFLARTWSGKCLVVKWYVARARLHKKSDYTLAKHEGMKDKERISELYRLNGQVDQDST